MLQTFLRSAALFLNYHIFVRTCYQQFSFSSYIRLCQLRIQVLFHITADFISRNLHHHCQFSIQELLGAGHISLINVDRLFSRQ